MKKHTFFLCAAAGLLALVSCSKNPVEEPTKHAPTVPLTVTIGPEGLTKSAFAERKDYQISSVQIFVFDAQNKMETDFFTEVAPVDNTVSVDIATFTGLKTVYAVINAPRITLRKDLPLASFEGRVSDLTDNSPTNLVMVGKNQVTVLEYDKNKNSNATHQTLNMYVKRLAAMIVLDKVTVDFTGTSLEGASITVKEIYLKNVVGKCHLGLSGNTEAAKSAVVPLPLNETEQNSVTNWYNVITKQATGAPAVTVDTQELALTTVNGGDGNDVYRCLFAYPNQTVTDSHAAYNSSNPDTWTVRKTRLVIKAFVSKPSIIPEPGTYTDYVFDLPVLEANRVYHVSKIKITMLGKDNDNYDDNLQDGKLYPAITVDDWTDTAPLDFEF